MNGSYNFQIIARLILIVMLAASASICFFFNQYILYEILIIPILIYVSYQLIKYLNIVNQQINFFFESIINEDFSSIYSVKTKNPIFKELNNNLAKVNKKMQSVMLTSAQQEQYFKALIEHIGTGILTFNKDGFVIDANSSFKNLLGLDHLTHLKQLNKVNHTLMGTMEKMRHKEQKLITIESKRKSGKVKLLLKAIAFNNGKEQLILVSSQDIDQELNENELDSWLKLIRVLTHEIMNSIAPITSLSETLNSFFIKDGNPISSKEINAKTIETTIRGLDVIQEQGKGLINFVESYRTLTRLPKPKKEKIQLHEFIEKNILIHQTNNSKVKITLSSDNKQLVLHADKELISQAFTNLLKNAFQVLTDSENPQIVIRYGLNDKGQIVIEIMDNGPGIDPEIIDEIFIPFFTTKENGSGIGLSLSRQIMRLHGGWLKVQSVPKIETVFSMIFQKDS